MVGDLRRPESLKNQAFCNFRHEAGNGQPFPEAPVPRYESSNKRAASHAVMRPGTLPSYPPFSPIRAFTSFFTSAAGSGWPGWNRIVPLLIS